MAAALTAAVSLLSSKPPSLPARTSIISHDRINFSKPKYLLHVPLYYRNVSSASAKVVPIRAQVTTDSPTNVMKVSKKQDEGVVVNKFSPEEPYIGRCLLNKKITGDDAPGETWHMVFSTEGIFPSESSFNGIAWLFLGVPASSSLLYKEEFEKMKEKNPDKFRLDFAISEEQTNDKGEKMYIQTRMAEYAEELWELLKKDNTYVYMSGNKAMDNGIDDIMVSLAAKDGIDWAEYKKQLQKGEQWNVEVY